MNRPGILLSTIFSLLLCSSLNAIEKKVVIEEAPFVPCTMCDLVTFNQSLLSRQLSGVKRGEVVSVIAWEAGGQNVLVDLRDGSRGYMPAFAFIQGGVTISVPDGAYMCCPLYDLSRNRGPIPYHSFLPRGTYRIYDAGHWSSEKRRLQCGFMEVVSVSNGQKYFVSNSAKNESYAKIDFRAHCGQDLKALPYEQPKDSPLFVEKKVTIHDYVGLKASELADLLGEPDARISKSRSGKGKEELFYRNVCYQDMGDRLYYNRGVVFYADDGGIVVGASPDAFLATLKKDTKCVPLPGKETLANPKAVEAAKAAPAASQIDPLEAFEDFNAKVSGWFGGRYLEKLLKLLLITLALCLIETIKIRLNIKLGSNKTVLRTAAIFPGIVMLYLVLVTTGNSSLLNILTLLLVAAVIYGTVGWNSDFVEKFRCEKCHRIVPEKIIAGIDKGHPYVHHTYTRKQLGTHFDKEFVPIGNRFNEVTETKTTDFEDRKYTYVMEDQTVHKKCPHCGNTWSYKKTVTLSSKMAVTDRFSTSSFSTYIKGQIQNLDTGEWVTVWKTGKNQYADADGNIYEQYRDGYFHHGNIKYW